MPEQTGNAHCLRHILLIAEIFVDFGCPRAELIFFALSL